MRSQSNVVEAMQVPAKSDGESWTELADWLGGSIRFTFTPNRGCIKSATVRTMDGLKELQRGDYVVSHGKRGFSVLPKSEFQDFFEEVAA